MTSWSVFFEEEEELLKTITSFIADEEKQFQILPPLEKRYLAFENCPLNEVKVCLYGQDPYHTKDVAHGLCFSVETGSIPPSLRNIYRELKDDLGVLKEDGNLSSWSKQGVLMLNSALTVRQGHANSHSKQWKTFTDKVIEHVSKHQQFVVFILWGNYAKSKIKFIDTKKHCVLASTHPSPLSANRGGFFGCKHFSKCNEILTKHGQGPIEW